MEKISVEFSVKEISITPHIANFQGYVNSHLVCSYECLQNSYSKKQSKIKQKQKTNKEIFCLVY